MGEALGNRVPTSIHALKVCLNVTLIFHCRALSALTFSDDLIPKATLGLS
jgi:hypothetical protein